MRKYFPYCLMILFYSLYSSACNKAYEPINSNSNPANTPVINFPTVKPNIILILGDDIGYEVPAVDGGNSYSTPNIDRMAKDGIRFTEAHASPLCSTSRFMLLTGKYNFRNYNQWGIMDLSQKTIANLLKDAGYKTCVTGKWQLSGGDNSIHNFGFDDYAIWQPYEVLDVNNLTSSRFKNPAVYTNGAFLPKSLTDGKYSEDMFMDHLFYFMENNVNNSFFAYCSMMLPHAPFNPTPDDPEFAAWNPLKDASDEKYYPSMVAYMDKKIGQLINKVRQLDIADKTIIIFVGDNGTDNKITSVFNGLPLQGGKGYTKEAGTHVPMIVEWPGYIQAGTINKNLIDLTDFLPTFANLAQIPQPQNYGTLDGTSFYRQLFQVNDTLRQWSFCHFDPYIPNKSNLKRWVQDGTYKLYSSGGRFYNILHDKYEAKPLANSDLTTAELKLKNNFQNVLDSLK